VDDLAVDGAEEGFGGDPAVDGDGLTRLDVDGETDEGAGPGFHTGICHG
jgi:hypothetical protein